jgi:hypothetical protein
MKVRTYVPAGRRGRLGLVIVSLVALFSAGFGVALGGTAQAAGTAVPLGTAKSFVVLAGAGVTNTGPTTVNGDLGTYPTTSITGKSTLTINGTNHDGDAVTQGAKRDLVTAYNTAAGEGPTSPIVRDLGGQTLTPGVYNSGSSIGLTGTLTLDARGNANAVFVFQAGSKLTTASTSKVNLVNGAQPCNVFWQVTSSAALGTSSNFQGTIIALTSITLNTGAKVDGRVLARNGDVTMDTNVITKPTCSGGGGTTTTTAGGSTTSTTTAGGGTTTTTVPPGHAKPPHGAPPGFTG